jgi:hypothetical protein
MTYRPDPAWPDDAYAVIPTPAGLRRPPVGWWTVTHCELRRSYFSVRQLPNRNTLRGLRLGPACARTSVRSTARRFIRNLAIAHQETRKASHISRTSQVLAWPPPPRLMTWETSTFKLGGGLNAYSTRPMETDGQLQGGPEEDSNLQPLRGLANRPASLILLRFQLSSIAL